MAKRHVLNGAQLDVRAYHSLLGKPQPDERDVELVKNVAVDAMKMQFIFEQCKADFKQVQDGHGVTITWKEGTSSVAITPKDETSGDKYNFDKACEAITSFLDEFVKSTTRVLPEAWQAVSDNFMKSGSPAKKKVKVRCTAEQNVIILIGKRQDVEGVAEELQGLIITTERKLKMEASKTTTTLDLPCMRLQFLKHLDFEKELETQHEETEVNVVLEKGRVQIRGPSDTIHKVSAAIWEAVAKMMELKLSKSQNVHAVLKSRTCLAFVNDQFTANNLQAFIAFDEREENLVVMGMKSDVAEKACDLVKKLIVEETVNLDEDQVQLEKSEKWRQLRDELTEERILRLSFDRSNKKVCLAGAKEDISFALGAVKRFLKENTIVSNVVRLPTGCRRFLVKYREQDLRQIQEDLKEHSTRLRGMTGEDEEDLVVSGTTNGVEKAMKLIQDLASKVESQKVPVSKPGMRKVLDRSKGKKLLGMLENENKCVIEYVVPRKDGAKEVAEEKKEVNKKKESLCDLLTPEGKKILVFKDNICDRNVDVIVNAANSKLQHVGGVSKAIFDGAGEAFKEECDRFVIDAGPILDGQVAVTSAGKLPFKKVIHAVGPQWGKKAAQEKLMGKAPREEKVLSYAIHNALDAAKDYKSVAIPAIGTGIFEFPRDLCAKIMVESVLVFFQENPSCLLSEIQFTSIDDDVVKALVKEMDSRFLLDPNYQTSSVPKTKDKARKGKSRGTSVPSLPLVSVSSSDVPNVIKTAEGIEVVLVTGDMSREKVSNVIFQKRVRVFHRGFKKTRKQMFSSVLKRRWNTKHEFLK